MSDPMVTHVLSEIPMMDDAPSGEEYLCAKIARLQEQVETLQYKAEKYDAVVKALSVCDGGRYRNDTIESCILALKAREAAEAERDRLREALDKIAEADFEQSKSELHDFVTDIALAALQKEPQP